MRASMRFILFVAIISNFHVWAGGIFPGAIPNLAKNAQVNGYYDRDMVWHAVTPARDAAYYEGLNPRPLVYYIANARAGEDTTYLNSLSEGSRTRLRNIVAMPDMATSISITRGSDGEWHYNYRLNSDLVLPISDTQDPMDRFTLKAAILSASSTGLSPSNASLLASYRTQVNDPGFNNLLLREWSCDRIANAAQRRPGLNCTPDNEAQRYGDERFRYYMRGFQHQAEERARTPNYHLSAPPRRVTSCASGASAPNYQFSLTPFKKGDLDSTCKNQVDNGVAGGFQKVTLFFPIHYSGGNTGGNPYGPAPVRDMREGWDYRYEDADGISEAELSRCLEYINRAGLQVNFVPHQESIVTMNSQGESEWRIHGNVPVNNEYYNHAYGPLLHYLQAHPDQARGQNIRVAAAAELDPSFIGNTRASLDMMRRLRREMTATGAVPEISWMPNGDFHNGWTPISTNHLDCSAMADLLREVDRIAPSLYQEYGHVTNSSGSSDQGAAVSFTATKEHFFAGMTERFRTLCPSRANELARIARARKFSVGEFALTGGSYTDFSAQMRAAGGSDTDATFWSSGNWDHAGISRPTTSPHLAEIAATTAPCGSGQAAPSGLGVSGCHNLGDDGLPVSAETHVIGEIRREIDP